MRILFVTCTGTKDIEFGGCKSTIRNFNALKKYAKVIEYPILKKSNVKSLISIFQKRIPPLLKKDITEIAALIKNKSIDAIFLDTSDYGDVAKLTKELKIPCALFYHNCESDYCKVRFKNHYGLKSFIYQKLYDKEERLASKYAGYQVTLTTRDKLRIEELYQVQVDDVIPTGMEDKYSIDKDNQSPEYCLLFGPAGAANLEGFKWFIDNVSPYIDCQTVLAGKGFESYKEWQTNKVEVVGYVEDINKVYSGAKLVAIPLLTGGGMKIKTVEALMFGKYIFGTNEAFVGYDFDYKKVGGLCNSPEEFIKGINEFLSTKSMFFNEPSRKEYIDKYSLSASDGKFRKIIYYFENFNSIN